MPRGSLAALLLLYAAIATLAPRVRDARPPAPPWALWALALGWPPLAWATAQRLQRHLPRAPQGLWPAAAGLMGLGLATLLRLTPAYGMRQALWTLAALTLLHLGLRWPNLLPALRRRRRWLLWGGLGLTALTLLLGTHPLGHGPRLWLGCCGVYFQPAEPLKLLYLIYLAAYLGNPTRPPHRIPAVWMALGLTLALLVAQRDLGTGLVFFLITAAVLYTATGSRRLLLGLTLGLLLGGLIGYQLLPTLRLRLNAWLDPWADPGGLGYQPIQALLALANGGVLGRGPGLGAPFFVPVAHSDFVYTAVAEELGLVGGLAVLAWLAVLVGEALRLAARRRDGFGRLLAVGLAAYYGGQSLLILGGNLRLFPLTGLPLPFMAYGGSSLLTATAGLVLLLRLGEPEQPPAPLSAPLRHLAGAWMAGLAAVALAHLWWGVVQAPRLLARTDNPRRAWEARFSPRGALLDRHNRPLALTAGLPGALHRVYYPPYTGAVLGYADPRYGLAGVEAALDDLLRGATGYPRAQQVLHRLLYGTHPAGRPVRLTLDAALTHLAYTHLGDTPGAAVLVEADGAVRVMASTPTFDPNRIAEQGVALAQDPRAPLLNRATLGQYTPGPAVTPWVLVAYWAHYGPQAALPLLPTQTPLTFQGHALRCARPPVADGLAPALRMGCPAPLAALSLRLSTAGVGHIFQAAGWFEAPPFLLPTQAQPWPQGGLPDVWAAALGQAPLSVSPLHLARAALALSRAAPLPALRLTEGPAPPSRDPAPSRGVPPGSPPWGPAIAQRVGEILGWNARVWGVVAVTPGGQHTLTWFVGGTRPGVHPARGVAVVLERLDPDRALALGLRLLQAGLPGGTP